ncbi:hypothetical protein [Serratia odorifera]|jgi:hypothetical protein|uniref:Uncharacterized protein n=2 Tax=Serratia odorifera TaxID=618 RepID=D4DW78_SEROD|nr:hypothetical protein [Serratia odorifera]EFE98133.1 hypothetical protein HMPREF0758_0178 [Serratia odorifera DSM 4582]MBJ2065658.1 hypothetical protein [Serratia odorifera]VDZ51797.1 Uncharacterised protein [Serratia odorifera]HEJ9095666.1 hypothetical protein [Serratia odorifera]
MKHSSVYGKSEPKPVYSWFTASAGARCAAVLLLLVALWLAIDWAVVLP